MDSTHYKVEIEVRRTDDMMHIEYVPSEDMTFADVIDLGCNFIREGVSAMIEAGADEESVLIVVEHTLNALIEELHNTKQVN